MPKKKTTKKKTARKERVFHRRGRSELTPAQTKRFVKLRTEYKKITNDIASGNLPLFSMSKSKDGLSKLQAKQKQIRKLLKGTGITSIY